VTLRARRIRGSDEAPSHRERWFIVASGVGALTLMGVAFVVGNVIPTEGFPPSGGYPSTYADAGQIEAFFSENAPTVRWLGATLGILAIILLAFVSSTARLLERSPPETGILVRISFASGTLACGFLMLSAILTWTLSRPAIVGSMPALRAVHDLTFLAGGPGHVLFVAVFLATASTAASSAGVLHRALVWLGAGAGAASGVIAVLAMLWRPATYALPLSRLLLGAWIVGVCLQMATTSRSDQALPDVAEKGWEPRRVAS
jgi:hypothetical protein